MADSSNMNNNEENKEQQLLLAARERFGSTIVIEQFLKFNPSSFDGTAATEKWLEDMEHILRVVECIDVEKVSCASFMLKNRACHWWESRIERNMTWAQFRQLVLEKYSPEVLRDQKEAKLLVKVENEEERKFDALKPKGGPNKKKKSSNQTHCTKCNRDHRGECLFGMNVCYKCGQPGHKFRQCTQNQGNKENSDQKKAKAKAKANHGFKLK